MAFSNIAVCSTGPGCTLQVRHRARHNGLTVPFASIPQLISSKTFPGKVPGFQIIAAAAFNKYLLKRIACK